MRILLLEDDAILGQGLQTYLRHEGHVVDWCTLLAQAKLWLATESFDVLLLDWRLPDGESVPWLASLRRKRNAIPTILMTAKDLLSERVEGLDSGADDYMVKPFAPEELSARLRALTRRMQQTKSSELVWETHGIKVDLVTRNVRLHGQSLALTAREWTLLEALVRRAGRTVSSSDLETLSQGMGCDLESNAIQVHISNLRTKLDLEKTWLKTIRGMGYGVPLPT